MRWSAGNTNNAASTLDRIPSDAVDCVACHRGMSMISRAALLAADLCVFFTLETIVSATPVTTTVDIPAAIAIGTAGFIYGIV